MKAALTIALLLLATTAKGEWGVSTSLLWHPIVYSYKQDALFSLPKAMLKQPAYQNRLIAEIAPYAQLNGVVLDGRVNLEHCYSEPGCDNKETELNELALSYGLGDWEFTMGRRAISWGVGYGFRPLNVVQRTDTQRISRESLMGIDMLLAEYYTEMGELAIMLLPEQRDQSAALVARYFQSDEAYDWQGVIRYDNRRKLQLGVGGVRIMGEALSLHGSALYVANSTMPYYDDSREVVPNLSPAYPYEDQVVQDRWRAVVGTSYTFYSGHSMTLEYGYDGEVLSHDAWQGHYQRVEAQRAQLDAGVFPPSLVWGNIAWTAQLSQMMLRPRHSALLYWSYDAEHWQPEFTSQISLQDQSAVSTLVLQRGFTQWHLALGIRQFTGATRSYYGALHLERLVYMTLSSEF